MNQRKLSIDLAKLGIFLLKRAWLLILCAAVGFGFMYYRASRGANTFTASGTMYPIPLIPQNMLYLQNFAWFDYIRPLNKDDIFEWRPKKAGSELKESVRHAAPKQKLSDIRKQRGIGPVTETAPESTEGNKDNEAQKDDEGSKDAENKENDESNDNKDDKP